MNEQISNPDLVQRDILKIAVIAVGGQGGGVLTNWIESLARAEGYACQATSVAGVAQRTGATIYYIEMVPASDETPVFSLAPAAGDVDIVIAAELMEAGRAIIRGFVTPDKTTFIASTHRNLAVSEKMAPGDGIADADEVISAAEIAARRLVMFDMDRLATINGSVISASLFGALAGTQHLPFSREAFEEAIKAGGKGVEPSLRAFSAAFDAVENKDQRPTEETEIQSETSPRGQRSLIAAWEGLISQINKWPEAMRPIATAGLQKVVDFQDAAYGQLYLDRIQKVLEADTSDRDFAFSQELAKYLANAMAYDDIIKVADLKTRSHRFARIKKEMQVADNQGIHLTEYFHPRAEEIISLLPAQFGLKIEASEKWRGRLDKWFSKGRRLRTDRLLPFLLLYSVGGLRGYRLRTLRHAYETTHLDKWMSLALARMSNDYDLGVEVLRCRRLIKGYSDTHARGMSKYDRVLGTLEDLIGRDDAAEWLRRLRETALKDEKGDALDGAILTVKSFTKN